MTTILGDPKRKMHKTAKGRNVELALRDAIACLAGKNVPDNTVQQAIRRCELALEEVRAR